MGESRNAYRVLVGRPEGKRPLGRPRRRWEDNIKMDLRKVGYDDREWINLTQDRDQWRAYMRAAMNLRERIVRNPHADVRGSVEVLTQREDKCNVIKQRKQIPSLHTMAVRLAHSRRNADNNGTRSTGARKRRVGMKRETKNQEVIGKKVVKRLRVRVAAAAKMRLTSTLWLAVIAVDFCLPRPPPSHLLESNSVPFVFASDLRVAYRRNVSLQYMYCTSTKTKVSNAGRKENENPLLSETVHFPFGYSPPSTGAMHVAGYTVARRTNSSSPRGSAKKIIYKTILRPVVTYASEAWVLTNNENMLAVWERKVLRKIYGPHFENGQFRSRTNKELMELYGEPSIVSFIKKGRLRWLGHLERVPEGRLPKRALYGHPGGLRKRGRPRLRWLQDVEDDLRRVGCKRWRQRLKIEMNGFY
ncbi:hypothetical protein ANN_12368 [Periplaneta americana]|uniref:Uncharacterized protein n=1 Tax=Periplaneta americana TaxID=6978 RepID=A0ABQ8TIH0_PERAM|nr:hypothetical protein ANN_12368 [Periplaneta americana]